MGKNKERNNRIRKAKRSQFRKEEIESRDSSPKGKVHTAFAINKIAIKYIAEQGFIQDRSFTWQLCFPNLCYVEDAKLNKFKA